MDFKDKTSGEVFPIIQLGYKIYIVFPKTILKTYIASSCIVLRHQVQAIYHFYSPRLLHRQSQPEIHPYSRTVMMLLGSRPVQHPGKMHSQHSQIINPNMLRSSNIVTGEKAITAILVTT